MTNFTPGLYTIDPLTAPVFVESVEPVTTNVYGFVVTYDHVVTTDNGEFDIALGTFDIVATPA